MAPKLVASHMLELTTCDRTNLLLTYATKASSHVFKKMRLRDVSTIFFTHGPVTDHKFNILPNIEHSSEKNKR